MGDLLTLARLAEEVGLDAAEVGEVLGSDRYDAAVRADQALACELGITEVPFFVAAGGLVAISGVPSAENMEKLLRDAWILSGDADDDLANSGISQLGSVRSERFRSVARPRRD